MSDLHRIDHAQARPKRPVARRRRWLLPVGLAVFAILGIAYFDGGEEPIRPIVQQASISKPAVEAN